MTDPYATPADAPFDGGVQTADKSIPFPPEPLPLVLYRVDTRGRVNLHDLVAHGTEFYTGAANPDGTITLSPVHIATTSLKRTEAPS